MGAGQTDPIVCIWLPYSRVRELLDVLQRNRDSVEHFSEIEDEILAAIRNDTK